MSAFISPHHGGGWRFQMHIPKHLRPMLGGKTAFRAYIPPMSRKEAEMIARRYALDAHFKLAVYRNVKPEDQDELAKAGGLEAVKATENQEPPEDETPEQTTHRVKAASAAYFVEHWTEKGEQQVQELMTSLPVSWDALFKEWVTVKGATRTRDHQRVIHWLKEFFGERDCRKLTMQDIGRFRDHLITKTTPGMVVASLQKLNAMFNAASQNPTSAFAGMPNPAQGVKVFGKPMRYKSRDPFSPEQARHILQTAKAIRFGDAPQKKRHSEVMWGLRLLAFTGARPSEIFQLQAGDVREENGIRFIEICNHDAVTGKPNPQKSLKRGETARKVPLHPEVMDFFDYAAGFAKGEFIFGAFKAKNGRASWLIQFFPGFLKRNCKIFEPTRKLVLYSFRHRFHAAMTEAGIPETLQFRLTGHKLSVHQRYGGEMLDQLAKKIPLLKPLG